MPIPSKVTTGIPTAATIDALIAPIARAVKDDRVTSLAGVLTRMDEAGAIPPELFLPANPARYARNLVFRDPKARFVVVAMTWGPGQGSPLHDHAGLWGAEIVTRGTMSETLFELVNRDAAGRYQFARGAHRLCEKGAIGVLIPPLEYHDYGNAGETVAHTLHVYGGDLTSSQAFAQDDDGWWRARRVELHYDA
jgi:3-mercaptopropionate dioxygenase